MECPKCHDKQQHDRYCSHCGFRLLAPCPDNCGKWEPIGRPVCATALASAKEIRLRYETKLHTLFTVLLFLIPLAVIGLAFWHIDLAKFKVDQFDIRYITIVFGLVLLAFIFVFECLVSIESYYQKMRRKNFVSEYPAEAEIIRLAEKTKGDDR